MFCGKKMAVHRINELHANYIVELPHKRPLSVTFHRKGDFFGGKNITSFCQ